MSRTKKMLLLVAPILLIIFAEVVEAQDDSNPRRGFQPGGSYAIGDIETVNTANGNLILNIPIASLPAGRGGSSGPGVSLTYNSKLWDIEPITIPGDPQTGGAVTFHDLTPSSDGGWRLNVPVFTANIEEFIPNGTNCNAGYVHKVSMTFPDGSRHDFYPAGYTIKNGSNGQRYSQIRYDGYKTTYFVDAESHECFLRDNLETTNTITYYSIDGTYLRLDVMHGGSNPWTLYFPDGRRVESPSFVTTQMPEFQRTYDSNNNYTDFQVLHNYGGQTNRTAYKLSDEFGRYLLIDFGDPGMFFPATTITAFGVNNEQLYWTISWKNSLTIINKTYCDHFATGGTCDSFNDVNVNLGGIDQITLPTQLGGLAYHFNYNSTSGGWGELNSITLPSGAVANYQYEQDGRSQIAWHKVKDNGVARKDLLYQLEYDQTSTAQTDSWFYTYNHPNNSSTVTGPDGGVFKFYHYGNLTEQLGYSVNGSVYKTERPDGTTEESVWRTNTPAGIVELDNQAIKLNAFIKTRFVSIPNALGQLSKTAVTDYSYDKNGNVTAIAAYDYIDYSSVLRDANGQPLEAAQQPALTSALLKRFTTNAYLYPTPDAADTTTVSSNAYNRPNSPRVRNRVAASQVSSASQVQARSEYTYDTAGNLTQTIVWDSFKGAYSNPLTTGNSLSTSNQYELWPNGATGKLVSATDAKGIQTRFTYGTVGAFTNLYPTMIQTAYGNSVQRTETREYDFSSGLLTKTTDVDNNVSTQTTYDPVGRPTLTQQALGTSSERRTATQYFDTERRVVMRSDLNVTGDAKLVHIQHYDQLGRIRLDRQLEDSSVNQAESSETVGIKVQTRYAYAGGNSYSLRSNPYRASTSSQTGTEGSMGWTRTKFDVIGRIIEVQTFAGSGLPAPWGTNAATTGSVNSSFDANFTTVTDQAGKVRRSLVDAIGRLIRVDEPDNANNLGSSSAPVQPTSYSYDVLGNLTTVTQGTQTRTFSYDSLSRLRSAINPESGTISYQYDDNGNLLVKTDARSVSAHYDYDALNRVTRRWYNGSSAVSQTTHNSPALPSEVGITNEARFYYDAQALPAGAPSYIRGAAIGRLVATTYGSGSNGDYFAYDILGRPTLKYQQVGALNYQVSASYNLSGTVNSLTYPSGHTISNSYDAMGRLTSLSGNLGDGATRTYSTAIDYEPLGGIRQEQFGTQTPLYHKQHYNRRGQVFDIRLSTVPWATDQWNWNRGALVNYYSSNYAWEGDPSTPAGPDNNGNVLLQQHWVPGDDAISSYSYTQDFYAYDSLNRISSTAEYHGTGGSQSPQDFSQMFAYDRWGNRTINPSSWGVGVNTKQFAVDTATNRLGVPAGQAGVMSYDNAGNLTTDTYTGVGSRTYDAENRMTTAADNFNQTSRYTYDADGHRVRRQIASSQEEWQIYGFDGELIAEYQAGSAASSPEKEYAYRNGQLLITASGRFNVALAANGAVASASSAHTCCGFSTMGAINGNYRGPWGNGEGWNDATPDVVPDWIQVDFAGSKTIDEIDVFSLHDNYTQENTPTETQTFSLYGLLAFDVQYWNGSSWITIPGGSVTGNNKVWRKFTFSPITTSKIRVYINQVPDSWSRVVEIQAFGTSAGAEKVQWLVSDHLGTPRITVDQTGNLAGVKRHDYLPFGEELFAGTGGRTTAQGYRASDGVRQQFTEKERDLETGLDYFLARYYSGTQGRFTSPDEFSGGAREVFVLGSGDSVKQGLPYADPTNPQTLNKYCYVMNNPLRFIDPDGHQISEEWVTIMLRWFIRQLDPESEAEQPKNPSPLSLDSDKATAQFTTAVANNAQTAFEYGEAWGIDFNVMRMARAMNRKDAFGMSVAAAFMVLDVISLGRGSAATRIEEEAGAQLRKRFIVSKGESLAPYAKMADWIAEAKNGSRGIVMEVFTGTNKSITQVRQQLENGGRYLNGRDITNVGYYVMVNSERAAQRVRNELGKVRGQVVKVIVYQR